MRPGAVHTHYVRPLRPLSSIPPPIPLHRPDGSLCAFKQAETALSMVNLTKKQGAERGAATIDANNAVFQDPALFGRHKGGRGGAGGESIWGRVERFWCRGMAALDACDVRTCSSACAAPPRAICVMHADAAAARPRGGLFEQSPMSLLG